MNTDEYPQTGNFDNGPEDGELDQQDDHDELEKEMKEWHLNNEDVVPSWGALDALGGPDAHISAWDAKPELAEFHDETHLCLHGKSEHCDECDIINFHVPVPAEAATSKGDSEARESTDTESRDHGSCVIRDADSRGVENPLGWINNQLAKYFH